MNILSSFCNPEQDRYLTKQCEREARAQNFWYSNLKIVHFKRFLCYGYKEDIYLIKQCEREARAEIFTT